MPEPRYPHRAQSWENQSGKNSSEYILSGALQPLAETEKNPVDHKLPYKAYIVGLKRLTLKARFANSEDALKAAKIQALAMMQQGK